MLIRLFIILIILLVSACDEYESEQTATPSSIPTEVEAVSSLTEIQGQTSAGLKGTDNNANGIRDDIDQLIEQKFSYTP